MKARVCVVMPTYNERENLEPTLSDLFARNAGVNVLIVDDNSPDGTGRLADVIASVTSTARDVPAAPMSQVRFGHATTHEPQPIGSNGALSDANVSTTDTRIANRINSCTNGSRLFVLHRPRKEGLGSAYVDGFMWALRHGYDLICEMDMDGSHRAEDLHRMLQFMERHPQVDLVLGSRRVRGGRTEDWPWYRDAISRLGSAYARTMLGLKVRDMTCGFRVYRASILRRVHLNEIADNGYVFQIDMTRRVVAAGGAVVELPIVFPERERGESKMTGVIMREAMINVTKWGVARITNGRLAPQPPKIDSSDPKESWDTDPNMELDDPDVQ